MVPLLTISIATYNRAQYLDETLAAIARNWVPEVEVLVVDGNSTDNTEEVCATFSQRYDWFRYEKLDEKGGVDKDFDIAVMRGRGIYCWLMGDDDPLRDGAIEAVMSHLRRDEFDLCIVNSSVHTPDLKREIRACSMEVSDNIEFGGSDMNRLARIAGGYMTFIGCIVIRKSVWLSRRRDIYFGTEFIHFGVVFSESLERKILILATPLIQIRYGIAQWTERAFGIWAIKWPKLVWSMPTLDANTKKFLALANPPSSFSFMLVQRAKWCFPRWSIREVHRNFGLMAAANFAFLSFFPQGWVRWLVRKIFNMNKKKYAVTLYDFETK